MVAILMTLASPACGDSAGERRTRRAHRLESGRHRAAVGHVEILGRDLGETFRGHGHGIVDQNIQSGARTQKPAHRLEIHHVKRGAFRSNPGFLKFGGERGKPRRVPAVDDEARAGLAQRKRHLAAQMPGCAGEERDSIIEAEESLRAHCGFHWAGSRRFSGTRGAEPSMRAQSSADSGGRVQSRKLSSSWSSVSWPMTTPSIQFWPRA